jgi:nucleolar protein 56
MTTELAQLREKCMKRTRVDLKIALALPDRVISQAVSAIGELEESLCVSSDRLREWYSLYYPEAVKRIRKQDAFARITAEKKQRSDFKDIEQDSIGADLSGKDLYILQGFAKSLSGLYSKKGELEEYLEKLMKRHFKNLYAVAGSIVGAKLIAHCGDSARLATLPSSTIQVLGAEKALFRHLITGAKPPKYGIILNHNLLQNARKEQRGKIARALASVISLAIKVDVYSQDDQIEFLTKKLENKLKVIERRAASKNYGAPENRKSENKKQENKKSDYKKPENKKSETKKQDFKKSNYKKPENKKQEYRKQDYKKKGNRGPRGQNPVHRDFQLSGPTKRGRRR